MTFENNDMLLNTNLHQPWSNENKYNNVTVLILQNIFRMYKYFVYKQRIRPNFTKKIHKTKKLTSCIALLNALNTLFTPCVSICGIEFSVFFRVQETQDNSF